MILLVGIFITYSLAIVALSYGFTQIKSYSRITLNPKTSFTIIVPFRNEAENLPLLLESLSKLNYPTDLFEVILVDDDSTEKFKIQDLGFRIQIIQNNRISNSPKKDAITTAMQRVNTDWVITTDADCIVPENWLLTFDNYIQENQVQMLAGAVSYQIQTSFLHHFQQLDLASLQGATIGSFGLHKGFMCNGANLAYTKSLFKTLNGFEGNEKIASGDDVFLLQKAITHAPERVHYLKSKNSIVTTKPLDDWDSLFQQRVRWAAKTTSYQSNFGKGLGIIVFMGNLAIILGLFLVSPLTILVLFLFKIIIDAILILQFNRFLSQPTRFLIASSIFYPFWSITVALYSLFGKYEWKDRLFTK
ncbi:glycosyltransferase [Flavobacterium sp. UMI-01]|uniref:glycosyltransferase family 2 protein n=1 Tax=Flavobacterium sp. UMI-01 TaxID=1441053 RepID=UPI001C7DE567|nr:glycosyltransferase [Flavobacterium sp. UMI-01]GIZ07277.1 glycosyl transferase [Flavobacterium sp. UMI-01]